MNNKSIPSMTARSITLAVTALLLLATLPASAQKPLKIATVDLQHLFKSYQRTATAQQEINVERAKVQRLNNERRAAIKALEDETQKLREQLGNPAVGDKEKQDLIREVQVQAEQSAALEKERQDFLQRRNTGLNENMVARMRGILAEIREKVEAHAKAEGYNLVVDKSGLSTSQMPVVLYSDIEDLTERVLAELNKVAPAGK